MKLADHVRSVRHTFASNRGRVALTLLGILIGAGSIVVLASLLGGGEEALVATEQFANDADLIQVDADEPPAKDLKKTRSYLSYRDARAVGGSPLLPGARVATERSRWWVRATYRDKRKRVTLVAAEPVALSLYRLDVEKGRFIDGDDMRDGRRVCVIGRNVWEQLLDSAPDLERREIVVEGRRWSVVGVLKNKPPLGGGGDGPWLWNNKILVPRTTFEATFPSDGRVDELFVRIGAGDGPLEPRVEAARGAVRSTLLRLHYGVANFKIDRWGEQAKQQRLILGVMKVLLLGTGLLSLFVGGINIMNIMLVTVTERTREIGVRRAVGATPRAIMTQFLLEAAFIAGAGGVVGVVCGMLLSWLAAAILTYVVGQWRVHIELWAMALGFGLSLLTGIVFGLFPAWRASRLDPVDALRYE